MKRGEIDQAIDQLYRALATQSNRAIGLIGLASLARDRGRRLRAFDLCQEALSVCDGDREVVARVTSIITSLVPGYHIPMMNDERRNLAWDGAIRRAIEPGMRVLEIGTGGGLLAMMAARAGAAAVITCESDPVLAALARDMISRNGYDDRIKVISKRSQEIELGSDLETRADLLICDIFSDNFVSFEPLNSISDARQRLLDPGAGVIPGAAAIYCSLVHWSGSERVRQTLSTSGFDFSPFRVAAGPLPLPIGSAEVEMLSHPIRIFDFDFGGGVLNDTGCISFDLSPVRSNVAHGVIQWISLELDEFATLSAEPIPGSIFFSSPIFYPFPEARLVAPGRAIPMRATHDGRDLTIWGGEY
jgi:Ribosomal protein L11 methyltransferase (PrmA)